MNTLQAHPPLNTHGLPADGIRIGRTRPLAGETSAPAEAPAFTMTMGSEMIELIPFKNWGQLDVHKWVARGKLPATPAGLEVTADHVKLAGEVVSINDVEGCSKLERAINEWLVLEKGTLELARMRSQSKPAQVAAAGLHPAAPQPLRYRVELDIEGQVHIRCVQGKEVLSEVGLTLPGINSLATQGLLHKPHALKVGALHDWLEMDGVFYSFEKGRNDAAALERVLNERYLSNAALGHGKDVVVFTNAASSTGFDIQFAVTIGGTPDRRRRPLNEETLELLQDSQRCGVLHKGLVVKLTRPTLVFKRKTADGGERYLEQTPETTVCVTGDDGQLKRVDLSQPVNYLHLSAVELTAIFNHPAINQHGQGSISPALDPQPATDTGEPKAPPATPILIPTQVSPPLPSSVIPPPVPSAPPLDSARQNGPSQTENDPPAHPPTNPPGPNAWLAPLLAESPHFHEWFTRELYCKLAELFENSSEAHFGPAPCWAIALGETDDIENPEFHGIFLTEKGSLGFLNHGRMARFYKSVLFVGTQESALEGIDIILVAAGLDSSERLVFIVSDNFLHKFGLPQSTVAQELERLKAHGAVIMDRQQAIGSAEAIEVVWSIPTGEFNEADCSVLESVRFLN